MISDIESDLEKIFAEDAVFFNQLITAIEKFPEINWTDAFSKGQLLSKLWLIKELKSTNINLGTIFVMGGWVGVLPLLMFRDKELEFTHIRSFDVDPQCAKAADTLNRNNVMDNWKFKASTADMFDVDYYNTSYETLKANGESVCLTESPDTIINTSCDHISPFDKWWDRIPPGTLVAIQNNNFFGADEDHTNNVKDLDQMKLQAPMSEILYEGELDFPQYKRFMLIGRR